MTENEAKDILNEIMELDDSMAQYNLAYMKAMEVAIKALEEVQQYRAIGTPEECRKTMEKQIPQKPSNESFDGLNYFPICPSCNQGLDEDERESFCECGQRLDWSDVE